MNTRRASVQPPTAVAPELAEALRSAFERLDTAGQGYVPVEWMVNTCRHTLAMPSCDQTHKQALLVCLTRCAPPNGMLTWERVCTAARLAQQKPRLYARHTGNSKPSLLLNGQPPLPARTNSEPSIVARPTSQYKPSATYVSLKSQLQHNSTYENLESVRSAPVRHAKLPSKWIPNVTIYSAYQAEPTAIPTFTFIIHIKQFYVLLQVDNVAVADSDLDDDNDYEDDSVFESPPPKTPVSRQVPVPAVRSALTPPKASPATINNQQKDAGKAMSGPGYKLVFPSAVRPQPAAVAVSHNKGANNNSKVQLLNNTSYSYSVSHIDDRKPMHSIPYSHNIHHHQKVVLGVAQKKRLHSEPAAHYVPPAAVNATSRSVPARRATLFSDASAAVCRICHGGEMSLPIVGDKGNGEPLISPCNCRGTMGLYHRSCLEHWLGSSNTASCEICQFPYVVKRKPKSFVDFWRSAGHQSEKRNLVGDLICFWILTPLALISSYLCIHGAVYYSNVSEMEAVEVPGLIVLAVFLVATYCTWLGMTLRYHYKVLSEWRRKHHHVKVMGIDELPMPYHKKNRTASTRRKSGTAGLESFV